MPYPHELTYPHMLKIPLSASICLWTKFFHADEEATGELHQVFGRCTPCNKKQIDSILGWVWEGWIWGHPPKVIWNRIQKFFHCLTLQKGLTLHGNSNASSRDGAAHLYVESITWWMVQSALAAVYTLWMLSAYWNGSQRQRFTHNLYNTTETMAAHNVYNESGQLAAHYFSSTLPTQWT